MTRRGPALPPTPSLDTTAWYGKVPARGDFVSQGLSPTQVRVWDGWLQRGLKLASHRWSKTALDFRLRALPAWRFLAWPEGLNSAPWAGVMVASYDRVGRAFPLTVLQGLPPLGLSDLGWLDIEAALARMADVALDATDVIDNADITDPQESEGFEKILLGLGAVFAPERVAARADMRVAARPGAMPAHPQQSAPDLARNSPGTQSLWWSEPAPGTAPLPLGDTWPPHAELLVDMLALPDDAG